VALDPFVGAAMAVAEVCRNLVVSGAEPIGLTDCLNFGSPERPEVMTQISRAIDGIAAACTELGVPIVSGNVSLYNETGGRGILPTPTLAGVGLLPHEDALTTAWFKDTGDVVVLLGTMPSGVHGLSGSEWLALRGHDALAGDAPGIDLAAEKALQTLLLGATRDRLLASAHDVADGGLATALVECCVTAPDGTGGGDRGARIDLEVAAANDARAAALFGEAPSRVVVSVRPDKLAELLARASRSGVPAKELGVVGGTSLSVGLATHGSPVETIHLQLRSLRQSREACLTAIVGS
jgi:phosphoribosylformylglycinamidine synthase